MKKHVFLTIAAFSGMLFMANEAKAQDAVVVEEETVTVTPVNCKTQYYNTWRDGWFLQLGAGAWSPFVEGHGDGLKNRHITATYNLGFGKWFSPYLGWRFSAYYGAQHFTNPEGTMSRMRSINGNFDLMWDMFNSLGGVNTDRVFSIVPYVGLGGNYNWNMTRTDENVYGRNGKLKKTTWTLPVSAGLQFRFRLCQNVDFFLEGRASFHGDNFNNEVYGRPVDINLSAIGGFTINFGKGRAMESYNPCSYQAYIDGLNKQINDLRGELATAGAALLAAQNQEPCPEVAVVETQETVAPAPMLSTVRFDLNSAEVKPIEEVNVYNMAEYMKANPEVNVVIAGYADKGTGTAAYNKTLSERRAQAIYDMLVNKYGISADRLTKVGEGSAVQPYDTNNWNRIVLFNQK